MSTRPEEKEAESKLELVRCWAFTFGIPCDCEVVGRWLMPDGQEHFFCDEHLSLIDKASIRDGATRYSQKGGE